MSDDEEIKDTRHILSALEDWQIDTKRKDLDAHAALSAPAAPELPFEGGRHRRHLIATIAQCRAEDDDRKLADRHFTLAAYMARAARRLSYLDSKEVTFTVE